MKNSIFLILTTFILFSFTSDSEVKEYIGVLGPLEFDGKSYHLKSSSKARNYYIQEYLGENDSLAGFNEMISLFVLNEEVSIEDAIEIKQQELDEFRKTDPVCNYAVTFGPKNSGTLIDFLRGESIGEVMTLVEFNLYRYKQIKIGKNKKAVFVFAFSKRAYGKDITPFLKSLREERTDYIEKVFNVELPEISLVEE